MEFWNTSVSAVEHKVWSKPAPGVLQHIASYGWKLVFYDSADCTYTIDCNRPTTPHRLRSLSFRATLNVVACSACRKEHAAAQRKADALLREKERADREAARKSAEETKARRVAEEKARNAPAPFSVPSWFTATELLDSVREAAIGFLSALDPVRDEFAVLCLDPRVRIDEVTLKKNYRTISLIVHPDKVPPPLRSGATAAFQVLTSAYSSLGRLL
jgi:hypothetical protein